MDHGAANAWWKLRRQGQNVGLRLVAEQNVWRNLLDLLQERTYPKFPDPGRGACVKRDDHPGLLG